MGKLTDKAIQNARPKDKQYSLADGSGLALIVRATGTKIWWLRYRFAGTAKTLSVGTYPIVGLRDAREAALAARRLLASGTDPSTQKIEKRAALAADSAKADKTETLEHIAREWFGKFGSQWVDSHASKIIRRLERDLFPALGRTPLHTIEPSHLLPVLRMVESRGAIETAHRLLQNCGQVWRYAVATGRAKRDITTDLRGALPPTKEKHLGAITAPNEIAILLLNINEYAGSEVVRHALQLAPHVFVRPGELRQAKWEEFDLVARLWT
ncbi:phage integrase family protein, partial [mine drainage metagenome]